MLVCSVITCQIGLTLIYHDTSFKDTAIKIAQTLILCLYMIKYVHPTPFYPTPSYPKNLSFLMCRVRIYTQKNYWRILKLFRFYYIWENTFRQTYICFWLNNQHRTAKDIWNEIYGPLVTIQYHDKWIDPLYRKVTNNKIRLYPFGCTQDLAIAYFLLLRHGSFNTPLTVI